MEMCEECAKNLMSKLLIYCCVCVNVVCFSENVDEKSTDVGGFISLSR